MEATRQQLIGQLIATYRDLNHQVRPRDEATLTGSGSTGVGRAGSVRPIVERMRDDELRFAQALRERMTGVPMPDMVGDEAPIIGTESDDDSTAVIISQFGTARATTLSMLREIDDTSWSDPIDGGRSLHERVQQLAANDTRHLERIHDLLGAAPAPSATAVSG